MKSSKFFSLQYINQKIQIFLMNIIEKLNIFGTLFTQKNSILSFLFNFQELSNLHEKILISKETKQINVYNLLLNKNQFEEKNYIIKKNNYSREVSNKIKINTEIKKQNFYYKNKAKYNKKIINIVLYASLYLIIIFLQIKNQSNTDTQIKFFHKYSSISLKIKGNEDQYIYYHESCYPSPPMPDEVYINGVNQSDIKSNYNFDKPENEIILIWKNNVDNTDCMFKGCSKITEINFSNFDTSEVTHMGSMFEGCSSLISLDLSNFNTEQVTKMYNMFDSCTSLISLNLSNFKTEQVTQMDALFYGCSSLAFIDLENSIINLDSVGFIFDEIYHNIIVCSKSEKWKELLSGYDIYINCNNNETDNQGHKCYKKSSDGEYNKYISKKCGNNFYQVYSDTQNNNSYINCYKIDDGFFLDMSEQYPLPKACYFTCSKCDKEGNETYHNCLECNKNYQKEINNGPYKNCYVNTYISTTYIDTNKETELISNQIKNEEISTNFNEIKKETEFVTNKINNEEILTTSHEIEKDTYMVTSKISNEEISTTFYKIKIETELNTNKKNYEEVPTFSQEIKMETEFATSQSYNIINLINTGNYLETEKLIFDKINISILINKFNKSYIEAGNDIELKEDTILYTLTSTNNQKNNILKNKNITSINFTNCEKILQDVYNITGNMPLYIAKIEVEEPGMKIPKIEYEVFYPLYNNDTLYKLNLSKCEGIYIDISNPVQIQGDISKYNKSSDYYKDICSKSISDSGTDITLKDRQNIFVQNNMTLCEEDCNLIEYNYTSEKAKCSCLVKISLPLIKDIKFDKEKLYKSFVDIENTMNIKLLKCYKKVFRGMNFKNNFGFIIYMTLIFFYFITLFLFWFKYYFILFDKIKNISVAKNNIFKQIRTINKGSLINALNQPSKNLIKKKSKRNKKTKEKKVKNNFVKENNKSLKKRNITDNKNKRDKSNLALLNNNNEIKRIIKKYDNVLSYNDYELNKLKYKDAITDDKRTYIEYYISLLRSNNLLIFSFYCNNNDYNSQIIKIYLFFFLFSIHLTINALFFNDSTIHEIYIDEGEFNFIYQIPNIIYSSVISIGISFLVKYLSLSEKNIVEMKQEKNGNYFENKVNKLRKILKIKFILFFILSFILLIISSFYIICFCEIYINTQLHLIKDTIISFCLSFLYPFFICLLPGLLRLPALQDKNKDKEYIYKLSQFLQKI